MTISHLLFRLRGWWGSHVYDAIDGATGSELSSFADEICVPAFATGSLLAGNLPVTRYIVFLCSFKAFAQAPPFGNSRAWQLKWRPIL